jgi:RNA polymerase sigma factor (sigma-70 family)
MKSIDRLRKDKYSSLRLPPNASALRLSIDPMNKERVLTQAEFDQLLAWLDPDRDAAGVKYEALRKRLIKIFICRGCLEAEELADETINRVTSKVGEVSKDYLGDPALYFYGVAQKVSLEYLRKRPVAKAPLTVTQSNEIEQEYECLEQCMSRLPSDNHQLVIRYYQEEKHAKIDNRKQLAEELGIAVNALRIRAHRIRLQLQQCVRSCLEQAPAH